MKSILLKVTEEEYEIIKKLAVEDAIKNNKRVSLSAYTASIMREYINGNRPPPEKPYIESPEKPYNAVSEPLQDSVIESPEKPSIEPSTKESNGYLNGINLDF